MKQLNSIGLIAVIVCWNFSVVGQNQQLKTLQLIKTYKSEKEYYDYKNISRSNKEMLSDSVLLAKAKPGLNYIKVSPDNKYFVACYLGEGGTDSIYFYNIGGSLIKKYNVSDYMFWGGEYSSNGEYFKVKDGEDNGSIKIFSNTGITVFK